MFPPLKPFLTLLSCIVLAACDPAFKTTAEQCANNQAARVVVAVDNSDPNVSPYLTAAGSSDGAYVLYLQDILQAAQPAGALDPEHQAALDTLLNKLEDDYDLGYELVNGDVTQAANPLDYLENLIASSDPDLRIQAFVDAKKQIADGLSANDDYCDYQNSNISIVDPDGIPLLFAEFSLSYSPFTEVVQQSLLITEIQEDLGSSTQRINVPYVGFFQSNPESYTANGYSEPFFRQALLNTPDLSENLTIDDGDDLKLGQLIFGTQNEFCDPDGIELCDNSVNTRIPVKSQCADDSGEPEAIDESNKVALRSFDLNAAHTDLKRIRLETDYSNGEVRVYTSQYNEAILDSDGVSIIHDPTSCEKQAILDELADLTPGEGVRLTVVPDLGFDITYEEDAEGNRIQDADGNDIVIEPLAAIIYQGTIIPARQ